MNINLESLYKEMECFAKEHNIPIMLIEGINYIEEFIIKNNIKYILEIGTAIGYSTIKMASVCEKVVSIERDNERYSEAVKNVKKAFLEDKISLINNDAFNVNINDKFDLILIDAAKAQNIKFIEKFKINLKENGYIIIDNVDFHGMVGNSNLIKSRNLRALVRKIEKFLEYLDTQEEFNVLKVNAGDGLIILSREE